MGDFYNQVTHFIPDFACKVTHFIQTTRVIVCFSYQLSLKNTKINAIGCGKVREMTHGVFYIINDRKCISKY